MFYDRISYGPYENAILNNGVNQVEYTVLQPDCSIPTFRRSRL